MLVKLIFILFLLLLASGEIDDSQGEVAIFESISQGDIIAIKFLIDTAEQIQLTNFQNLDGHTPLHWACNKGEVQIVEYLLNKGADVTISNDVFNGFTALHWASSNGFEDIVKLLIRFNANLEAKDFNGRTPLHLACERGNQAIALSLIQNGADVHAESSDLKTPLHYSAFVGMLRIVNLLIERNVNVNIRTKWGDTALHYASSGQTPGHTKIIQLLLAKGADVDARGMQGDTPFHWACWKGLGPIATLLVRSGADIHWVGRSDEGDTPFSLGACETDPLRSQLIAAFDAHNSERQELLAAAEDDQAVCEDGRCSTDGGEREGFPQQSRIATQFSREEL